MSWNSEKKAPLQFENQTERSHHIVREVRKRKRVCMLLSQYFSGKGTHYMQEKFKRPLETIHSIFSFV